MEKKALIRACKEWLRNAKLHLDCNDNKEYFRCMSALRELLMKKLVEDIPT